jgi:ADP-heptose:LPS heptosyltransferase
VCEYLWLKSDCRYFKGSRPCLFNKHRGQECLDCLHYSPVAERILIIKLDAIGDVLRTSCITPKIKEKYPHSYLAWITREESLDMVRANPDVDAAWTYGVEAISYLQVITMDYVYSCSNDHPSAALATMARARKAKIGFLLSEEGFLAPTNEMAQTWLEMAAFDSVKQANRLSFQEILYGICGFSGIIHRPRLVLPEPLKEWAANLVGNMVQKPVPVIGVNIGAGSRWPKKFPDVEQLVTLLSDILISFPECQLLLLGGPEEFEKSRSIMAALRSPRLHNAGCTHSLMEFAALISQCWVLVCGDTLAMHIAAGLGIPAVALFGPTSLNEIYTYDGLIEKLASDSLECLCCYSDCNKEQNCMTTISNLKILDSLGRQLQRAMIYIYG